MTPFKDKVIQIVSVIPSGKVVSYGQVAAYAGLPRGAREVGWLMSTLGDKTPWWRVVNDKGILSIHGNSSADKVLQAKLLRSEGIVLNDEFQLSMQDFRFKPTESQLKEFQLEDDYIRTLIEKYGL